MKKIILASVLITGVIVSTILIWKFYPRADVVDIHEPTEVIEEDSLVSLFAGSSLVKGGSSSFLIIGLLALAFYYIRRKENEDILPLALLSSPPDLGPQHHPWLHPNGGLPLLPCASPFNPSYLGLQRAICHDQEGLQQPAPNAGPPGPLSRDQIGAVLTAVTGKTA